MTHTPGPFEYFETDNAIGVTAPSADVALCSGFHTGRSKDEERANARLFAAALEMRDALKRLASFETMTLEGWGFSHPELTARAKFAEHVLAKAEGRTE